MEYLAHRGFWHLRSEQNSETAFRRALAGGFGIETDLRDHNGKVVISHDMATESALTLEAFLQLYVEHGCQSTLALNIKADGLHAAVADCIARYSLNHYFLFDMSIPDTLGYLQRGLMVFTRRSEFEAGSRLDERALGLWLDALEEPCVTAATIRAELERDTRIAIVSPELHRRPHKETWRAWRSVVRDYPNAKVLLCTDYPVEASEFFGEC